MDLKRWYAVAGLGLLAVAGLVAWRTWRHTSAGSFDPVSAVISVASLAVGLAAVGLAARAQQNADSDVIATAGRLAIAVGQAESRALWQLLGGDDHAIDVGFTLRRAAAHNASEADSTGTLEEVVAYYRKLRPRRMVITGAAGSGKTVLAVKLILGLLDGRADDDPVPVRVSAALLDTTQLSGAAVPDWLMGHLQQTYRLPKATAEQLVAARMILPVLDGLDEMDAIEAPGYTSRAGQAIRACNAYLDGAEKAAIVLTCRIKPYEALEEARLWVRDAARVQLSPVGVTAARRFLARRADDQSRWQPILDQIRRPGRHPLARALSTPWRLAVAANVYDQRDPASGRYLRDPADLTNPGLDTDDKIRDHLLRLYIPAAVAAHGNRYPAARVHRWLGVLARYLDANTATPDCPAKVIAGRSLSGTDLVLHELWPLAGSRMPRIIVFAPLTALAVAIAMLSLAQIPIGFGVVQIVVVSVPLILMIYAIAYSWTAWPYIYLFSIQRLKTKGGIAGLIGSLLAGLTVWFLVERALGLVIGLTFGLTFGLTMDNDHLSVVKPRQIVNSAAVVGLINGLAFGLFFGVVFIFTMRIDDWLALGFGLGFGTAFGIILGLTGWRYIALLLCTRRWTHNWLPWQLGSFLQWCYEAGLIRVAGIGYQFRHKELQDYLALDSSPIP